MKTQLTYSGSMRAACISMLVWVAFCMGCAPSATDWRHSLSDLEQRQAQSRQFNTQAVASKDLAEQDRLLTQAVALDEMNGEAAHNLGVVRFHQGQYYQAASLFQHAADLMPSNPMPAIELAILHAGIHQWDRALHFARQAYERDPHQIRTLRVLARCLQATRADNQQLETVLQELAKRDASPDWRQWAIELSLQTQDQQGTAP